MRTFILLLLTTYLTYAYCANRVSDNITKNSIAGLSLENQEIQEIMFNPMLQVRTGITIGKKSFKKHLQNS